MEDDDEDSVYIDGGFGANCPSEQVYYSIQELSDDDPQSVRTFVSIGTGKPPHTSLPKKALPMLSNSYLRWIPRYINAALVNTTDSEKIHARVRWTLKRDGVQYSRLNVDEGIGHIKLDAFKGKNGRETLDQLIRATAEYLTNDKEARAEISKLASLLVDARRSRADHYASTRPQAKNGRMPEPTEQEAQTPANSATNDSTNVERWQDRADRWEIFVYGVRYSCQLGRLCGWGTEKMGSRQELRHHYAAKHGFPLNDPKLEERLDRSKKYPIQESAARNRRGATDQGTSRQSTSMTS